MRYSFTLLLFCLISLSSAEAQHFMTGAWEGNYYGGFLAVNPKKLRVDLNITDDNVVTGSSHLYHYMNQYEHYSVNGKWNPQDSTIFFSEDSTLGIRLIMAGNCSGDYTMKLTISDTMMRLEGRWKDNKRTLFGCGSSGVWLEKPIKRKPKAAPDCFTVATVDTNDRNLFRKEQIQSLIELSDSERDSIRIELVDNAQVDMDMVSLYLNDCQLLKRYSLTATPHVLYLSIPKGVDICNIKMAAESEGSLPPCTALIRIITRKKSYEINLSSSMTANSILQFFVKQ